MFFRKEMQKLLLVNFIDSELKYGICIIYHNGYFIIENNKL